MQCSSRVHVLTLQHFSGHDGAGALKNAHGAIHSFGAAVKPLDTVVGISVHGSAVKAGQMQALEVMFRDAHVQVHVIYGGNDSAAPESIRHSCIRRGSVRGTMGPAPPWKESGGSIDWSKSRWALRHRRYRGLLVPAMGELSAVMA